MSVVDKQIEEIARGRAPVFLEMTKACDVVVFQENGLADTTKIVFQKKEKNRTVTITITADYEEKTDAVRQFSEGA